MTAEQTKEAVLDIIRDINPDLNLDNLKMDVVLREQIDLDSMDFLDIVMELRKKYGIEVPEGDYPQLSTLAGCMKYLQPKMPR